MKSINEIISAIQVEPSNLQHIAETGKINGSLLVSLRNALREYAEQAIDQCAILTRKLEYQEDKNIHTALLNVKKLLR